MTLDEVKRIPMRDVVGRYGFRPSRSGFIHCPFHQGDKGASLKIYARDWHCHACSSHGDQIDFVRRMDNLTFKERKREIAERIFNGRAFLLMSRNFRSLLEEYRANYEKDYNDLKEKFYVKKKTDVTVPADEAAGIEEHVEPREIEVLKPDCTQEQYEKELNELLDLETRKIQIAKIKADDLADVRDYAVAMALDFMVE